MRKALIALAVVGVVVTGGTAVLMIMFADRYDQEKKRSQTAKARAARWAKDGEAQQEEEPKTITEDEKGE